MDTSDKFYRGWAAVVVAWLVGGVEKKSQNQKCSTVKNVVGY